MPSRWARLAIVVFWLATLAYVVNRDVRPRYFGDAPPAVQIDLADEATPMAATRWSITRNGTVVGTLVTRMTYEPTDDTFRFENKYTNLQLETGVRGIAIAVPNLTTTIQVDRSGALKNQRLTGELQLQAGPATLGRASAEVTGRVVDGQLIGQCVVSLDANAPPIVDQALRPVPDGQVLNPLMPVHRLRDVRPGQRWVVRPVNPLMDAAALTFRELAKESALANAIPLREPDPLIAEVGGTPETVTRVRLEPVECWVISYRGRDEVEARTWVSVADGRVIRQEAGGFGETLRFERQD